MSIPSANHLIIFYFQRLLSSIKGKINCPSNNYFLSFKLIHFPRFRKQESGQYLYVEIGIVYKKLDMWRIFFNPCLCNLAPSWKVLEFIHYFCYHGSCFQSQWRLVAELMWFCLGREETENPLVPVYHRAGLACPWGERAGAREPAWTPQLPWEEDAPPSRSKTLCGCLFVNHGSSERWGSVLATQMCNPLNTGD